MKYVCYVLALFLLHGPALAGQNCETQLFEAGSQLLLSDHPGNKRFLKVVVLTAEGTHISCADRPRTEARQIRRLASSVGRTSPMTLGDLIGLSAVSWTQMARGASQRVAKRSRKSPDEFDRTHVQRIERLVLDANPSKGVANNLMRSLAHLRTAAARDTLISILQQSSNTLHQVIAARMLAQNKSTATLAALQLCSGLDNRMVSAQCKRSLLRHKVRAKADKDTP